MVLLSDSLCSKNTMKRKTMLFYNRQSFIWPNSVYLDASGKSVANTNIPVNNYTAIYKGYGDGGFTRGLGGIGETFISSADFWKFV